MPLFVSMPRRRYEINHAYLMALSFLIFFAVGKTVKAVFDKQKRKNAWNITIPNPRGRNIGLKIFDYNKLAITILYYIADNERYLVKDPKIIKLIFGLVKAKIKEEFLVLTPNIMRFLALKLLNNNKSLILKIGNIIVLSTNQTRLIARLSGSAIIGFLGTLFSIFPYAILMPLRIVGITVKIILSIFLKKGLLEFKFTKKRISWLLQETIMLGKSKFMLNQKL